MFPGGPPGSSVDRFYLHGKAHEVKPLLQLCKKKQHPRCFPPHQTKKGSIGSIGSIGSWPSSVQHLHETEGILWHPRHSCESPQHKAERPQETDQDRRQRNGTTMEAQQHTKDLRKISTCVGGWATPTKYLSIYHINWGESSQIQNEAERIGWESTNQCQCHRV